MLEFWQSMLDVSRLPEDCIGFLVDQRHAELEKSVVEYKGVTDLFMEHPEVFERRKVALLVDSPKQTAEFIMMQRQSGGAKIKPFSDKTSALKWMVT
ncbi:MAG: hypothetical protein ACK5LR_03705 [Mangrovibacterium sp.]